MKRCYITFSAKNAAQEGYLLHTAAKILNELQAMGTGCRLVPAVPPWQLAMEAWGDGRYIKEQVLDLYDRRKGTVLITEDP
ncbi:MAG: hypothetical protein J6J43_09455 [Oscillospiraceae bacterium]|nr:hypothetical protein [Oscillospiraceae bacterium]